MNQGNIQLSDLPLEVLAYMCQGNFNQIHEFFELRRVSREWRDRVPTLIPRSILPHVLELNGHNRRHPAPNNQPFFITQHTRTIRFSMYHMLELHDEFRALTLWPGLNGVNLISFHACDLGLNGAQFFMFLAHHDARNLRILEFTEHPSNISFIQILFETPNLRSFLFQASRGGNPLTGFEPPNIFGFQDDNRRFEFLTCLSLETTYLLPDRVQELSQRCPNIRCLRLSCSSIERIHRQGPFNFIPEQFLPNWPFLQYLEYNRIEAQSHCDGTQYFSAHDLDWRETFVDVPIPPVQQHRGIEFLKLYGFNIMEQQDPEALAQTVGLLMHGQPSVRVLHLADLNFAPDQIQQITMGQVQELRLRGPVAPAGDLLFFVSRMVNLTTLVLSTELNITTLMPNRLQLIHTITALDNLTTIGFCRPYRSRLRPISHEEFIGSGITVGTVLQQLGEQATCHIQSVALGSAQSEFPLSDMIFTGITAITTLQRLELHGHTEDNLQPVPSHVFSDFLRRLATITRNFQHIWIRNIGLITGDFRQLGHITFLRYVRFTNTSAISASRLGGMVIKPSSRMYLNNIIIDGDNQQWYDQDNGASCINAMQEHNYIELPHPHNPNYHHFQKFQ